MNDLTLEQVKAVAIALIVIIVVVALSFLRLAIAECCLPSIRKRAQHDASQLTKAARARKASRQRTSRLTV